MKKHYMSQCLVGIGWRYTACGEFLPQSMITVQQKRVTCKSCKKTSWWRLRGNKT